MDFAISMQGEGFVFIGTLFSAFSTVLIKIFSDRESPVVLSGYALLIGGIILVLVGTSLGGHIEKSTLAGYLNLGYLAFLSAAAFSIWGLLMKYNPVPRVAIFKFLIPIFGALCSVVLLKESTQVFSAMMITAIVLVSAGIIIVNKK